MVEARAVASALVFRAFFPPHPALSLGERENRTPRFRQFRAPRLVATRGAGFPLPAGEGEGEGEGDAANQNGRTTFAGAARPTPRLGARPSVKGASSVFNRWPQSLAQPSTNISMLEPYVIENCPKIVLASRRGRRFNAFAKKGQTFHRFKAQLRVKHA